MKWSLVIVSVLGFVLENCDALQLKGRIVNGHTVNIADYPYQVSVRVNDRHSCGGAIISPDSILTAAHCSVGFRLKSLSITHGSNFADGGLKHKVVKVIENIPNYEPDTFENDVAILKISPPITYTNSSQPIKLSMENLADGSEVIISGWGRTYEHQLITLNMGKEHLRAVAVNVINGNECKNDYNQINVKLDEHRICAATKGKDSCTGDSGGPLISKTTRQLVGVCSFGFGCARPNYPGVYTRVASYIDFIRNNM